MSLRPAGPVAWPDGKTSAASISFDVDAESAVLSTHPEAASRLSLMSHQAYGPLTGLPRLPRVLERRGVRAGSAWSRVTSPGLCCDTRAPPLTASF